MRRPSKEFVGRDEGPRGLELRKAFQTRNERVQHRLIYELRATPIDQNVAGYLLPDTRVDLASFAVSIEQAFEQY